MTAKNQQALIFLENSYWSDFGQKGQKMAQKQYFLIFFENFNYR